MRKFDCLSVIHNEGCPLFFQAKYWTPYSVPYFTENSQYCPLSTVPSKKNCVYCNSAEKLKLVKKITKLKIVFDYKRLL